MSDPLSDLIKQLSSKGDWAVVLPAALTGFVADATLHLVPLSMLSPEVCGIVAGGTRLSIKRAVETLSQRRSDRERLARATQEALTVADQLERNAKPVAADELRFEATMASDVTNLLDAIRRARAKL